MSKKTRFLSIMALALLALFLLPGAAFASARHTSKAVTANFAFTGLINKGLGNGTPLTGGLTISIEDGKFTGALNLHGSIEVPVTGTIASDGSLSITFELIDHVITIQGQGTPSSTGEYTGPFQVLAHSSQVASGIWSAIPVAHPYSNLAFAFVGKVLSGPDTGTVLSGALLLNKKTLTGTLNLPSGPVIPVSAKLSGDDITVTFDLGNGVQILGTGEKTYYGFSGPFTGPGQGDQGSWVAKGFRFGF